MDGPARRTEVETVRKPMTAFPLAGSLVFVGAAMTQADDPTAGEETAACFANEPRRETLLILILILIGIGSPNSASLYPGKVLTDQHWRPWGHAIEGGGRS